jgi:hypothetical protein
MIYYLQDVRQKLYVNSSSLQILEHGSSILSSLFDHHNILWIVYLWRYRLYNLFGIISFSLLELNIHFNTLFSNDLNLCSFFNAKYQVPTYEVKKNIIAFHILVLDFLDIRREGEILNTTKTW